MIEKESIRSAGYFLKSEGDFVLLCHITWSYTVTTQRSLAMLRRTLSCRRLLCFCAPLTPTRIYRIVCLRYHLCLLVCFHSHNHHHHRQSSFFFPFVHFFSLRHLFYFFFLFLWATELSATVIPRSSLCEPSSLVAHFILFSRSCFD